MRRRSTFIPSPGIDYDPSEVKINDQHLSFAGLKAAREEKLTLGLSELPEEIVQVLANSHEFHVRWVSEAPYQKSSPYLSSLPSGLHVRYTPRGDQHEDEEICQLLKKLFSTSLRCSTPNLSFSRPQIISERFASAASLQYYTLLPSVQQFVTYIQRTACQSSDRVCNHTVALLNLASYIDLDYDALSHALSITTYWSKPPPVLMDPIGEWTTYDHWNLAIDGSPSDRNELGILQASAELSPAAEPNDIQLEGFLTVLGQDTTPKPTIFSFPSRHQKLPPQQATTQQYTTTFDQPTGLHPTLRITFPNPSALSTHPLTKPNDSTCALHAYLTLPSALFPDEYAFPTTTPDPLFTAAHNILTLRSHSGEKDLEAPDYNIQKWGSAILLELATPPPTNPNTNTTSWSITIPLHLRYLPATANSHTPITIPHPTLFWACPADDGTKFTVNPFDRVNLGYDGLFGPRTMFYHLEPLSSRGLEGSRLVESLNVPVLDTRGFGFGAVELVTGLLVLGGFLYVAGKVVREIVGGSRKVARGGDKSAMKKKQ